MTAFVESYVIVLNISLILGALILAFAFFFGGVREIFRPMAWREMLLCLVTFYSIFADNLLRDNPQWRFLIDPPYRPAIYRTPLTVGAWIVIFAFWRWKTNGSKQS